MMKQPNILLVEDESHIARGLIFNLELEGYRVTHAETGAEAMAAFSSRAFDLVVLDLMLPDSHGIDLCRLMRKAAPKLPILMLTALGEEQDRIKGLKEGADDYLSKPFNLDEFLLRVHGMLRRLAWYQPAYNKAEDYLFGSNRIDMKNLEAETAKGKLRLTLLEGRMLETFFANNGETLTRAELLKSAWGMAEDTETRTLDNFIVRLRKYFEDNPAHPKHFVTVRGRGYRFVREPEQK
jgi:two-component system alkaline phosphatase synthesis response regulator PhoP